MSIAEDIKAEFDKGKVDIRKELPKLMSDLGVNTSDEHEVFHAVLTWLVKALAASSPVAETVVTEAQKIAPEIAKEV